MTRLARILLVLKETGAASTLALDVSTSMALVRAARIERTQAGARELAGLQGRYWSAELDCFWEIEPTDGNLRVRGPGRFEKEPPELEPLDRDRFDGPFFDVAFERHAGGDVAGFRVLSDRASGIVFERTTR